MVASAPSPHTPPTAPAPYVGTVARSRPRLFGQWLVNRDVITAADLREALALMKAVNSTIGELAVAHGLVTAAQAEEINELQRHVDGRWGDIAIALGVGRATAARIEQLAWEQQIENLRLSDALVELGFVSATEVEDLLAEFDDDDGSTDAVALDAETAERIELLTDALPRLLRRMLGGAARMSAPRPNDGTRFEHAATFEIRGEHCYSIGITADRRVARALADALHVEVGSSTSARLDTALGALLVLYGGHLARRLETVGHGTYLALPPVAGALPEGRWALDLALADGRCTIIVAP